MGRKKNRDKANGTHRLPEEGVFGFPPDVFTVMAMNHFGTHVGEELFNWCQEVIAKYPEYFPWETKLKSIPDEVHTAYKAEAFPPLNWESWIGKANQGEGIMAKLEKGIIDMEAEFEKNKNKTVAQLFDEICEMSEHQRMKREHARKVAKDIWDKHYKKYGLEYRG